MNLITLKNTKKLFLKYILFLVPAMLLASKGFTDLWISGQKQPYIALTLLMLSVVSALMFLTLASVFLYLSHRQFWIPPGKLILLITGMKLYFDFSLGNTVGLMGLAVAVEMWLFWGIMACRKNRRMQEQS